MPSTKQQIGDIDMQALMGPGVQWEVTNEKQAMSNRAVTNLLYQQAIYGVALLLQGVNDCMLELAVKVLQHLTRTAATVQLL